MACEIRPASDAEILDFYSKRLMMHHVAVVDGKPVAMGGVAKDNGQLWGFLDVQEGMTPEAGMAIVRSLRRGLKNLKQTVYVQCDNEQAERLLKIIGFERTDVVRGRCGVWKYHG